MALLYNNCIKLECTSLPRLPLNVKPVRKAGAWIGQSMRVSPFQGPGAQPNNPDWAPLHNENPVCVKVND